jgi:protocatechuate 3,4-dioxygenase beta subunit
MRKTPRREFIRLGGLSLAALSSGAVAFAAPTEGSGELGEYGEFLESRGELISTTGGVLSPTEDNILGPYHREGAPFRAKITPPLAPGDVLVISGRVYGHDTGKPLANAQIDIWQANKDGRYDNDDPKKPPEKNVFVNRARLITDASGYYEYETIRPGRYKIGPDAWRPAHIHYMVRQPGYKTLVTQMYFKGDPMNSKDHFIKKSLIIDPRQVKTDAGIYERGEFDIVLAKA